MNRLKKILLDNPQHFFQSVERVLEGCYGKAGGVISNKHVNRMGWLFTTTAGLEYSISNRWANKIWNELSEKEQFIINERLDAIIKEFEDRNHE